MKVVIIMATPCAKSLGELEVGAQDGAQDAWRRACQREGERKVGF